MREETHSSSLPKAVMGKSRRHPAGTLPSVHPASVPTPDFRGDTSPQLSGPELSVWPTPPVSQMGAIQNVPVRAPGHGDWFREGRRLWRWGTLAPGLTQSAVWGRHSTSLCLCFFICTKEIAIVLTRRVLSRRNHATGSAQRKCTINISHWY